MQPRGVGEEGEAEPRHHISVTIRSQCDESMRQRKLTINSSRVRLARDRPLGRSSNTNDSRMSAEADASEPEADAMRGLDGGSAKAGLNKPSDMVSQMKGPGAQLSWIGHV